VKGQRQRWTRGPSPQVGAGQGQAVPPGGVAALWLLSCRGDDLWGMPRAELSAGWRPRSLHGSRMRRPAPPEGPAVPAAGWRLHRGGPEPGDEDKNPPTAVSPKVAWPRQDRQRQRTGVTHAMTEPDQTSDQGAFPTKGSEAKGRAYASQMPVQGGKALYKA
jgi:hypothetical protein